jgi:DNA repair exonuclease SbcCD nuclease subunit
MGIIRLKDKVENTKAIIEQGIIIVSDIHLGVNNDNPIWHNLTFKLFDFIFSIANKYDIRLLVILGDLFHQRKSITQQTQTIAHTIIKNSMEVTNIVIIAGNHDIYYNDKQHPNWLTQFHSADNCITVEDEPLFINDYCFVPWNYPIEKINKGKYLFCHYPINGFQMNSGYDCQDSIFDVGLFDKFKKVYTGHFHNRSQRNNITYVGSPFPTNFGEDNNKGIHIFKNDKDVFIPFKDSPKFIKITTDDDISEELINGNFIELTFTKDFGLSKNELIIQNISLYNPLSLSIKSSIVQQDNKQRTDLEIKDNEDLMIDYIDENSKQIPKHLNPETLKIIAKGLLKSVNE